MMPLPSVVLLSLLLSLWSAPGAVAGNFFECTKPTGERYATDRPCKPGDSQKRVMTGGSRPSSPQTVTLPLISSKNRGQYWIDAVLNGVVQVRFLIDTGASLVVIPEEVLEKLTARGTIKSSDKMGTVRVGIADGSVVAHQQIHLRSLELGSVGTNDVVAAVGKKGVTPLLSIAAVEKIGAWRIDQQHNTLILNVAAGGGLLTEKNSPDQTAKGTPECVRMNRDIKSSQEVLNEIKNDQKLAAKQMEKMYAEIITKQKDLQDAKKEVNLRSAAGVRHWNNQVAALTKEQESAALQREKYDQQTAQRKSKFAALVEETKQSVEQFNKKCSGTLYQKDDGGWEVFQEYTVSKPAS